MSKKSKTMPPSQGSPRLSLSTVDYKKILKGAAFAFGGAAIAQVSIYLSTGVVFEWKIWLASSLAVGLNAAWKFIVDTTK